MLHLFTFRSLAAVALALAAMGAQAATTAHIETASSTLYSYKDFQPNFDITTASTDAGFISLTTTDTPVFDISLATADDSLSTIARASGRLQYAYSVVGAPNSLVPVNFNAYSKFWDLGLGKGSNTFASFNAGLVFRTTVDGVQQELNLSYSQGNGPVFGLSWQGVSSTLDSIATIVGPLGVTQCVTPAGFQCYAPGDNSGSPGAVASAAVRMFGTMYLPTDSSGHAYGEVAILAAMGLQGLSQGVLSMDPYLSIDPAYLAVHPGAQLVVDLGVGNTPLSAVPEVPALEMTLMGLMTVLGRLALLKSSKRVAA